MSGLAFRRVLCPVDLSDHSAAALRYGGFVAGAAGAELELLHAFNMEVPPYVTSENHPELMRQIGRAREEAGAAVAAFVSRVLGPDHKPSIQIVDASPVEAILDRASGVPDSLIVMGSHGRSGFQRLLLGSVTERVLRETRQPVLVVKAVEPVQPQVQRMVCPVNRSAAAKASLTWALALASGLGAQLEVVHVREADSDATPGDLCAWVGAQPVAGCQLTETIRQGDAGEQILRHLGESHADLLIVGSEHKPLHDVSVIGTTTVRLVRHAPCPVLVIPAVPDGSPA